LNYSTVKSQIHQIIISEVAKYYEKAISPAGLSIEDLKCLEIIAKISQFEQDIKVSIDDSQPSKEEISDLLALVKQAPKND
jgi:hypothetical protein